MKSTFELPAATLHVRDHDPVRLLAVTGDIDMNNVTELLAAVTAALDSGPAGVVVDLTTTSFFCSAGINLLGAAATRARDRGVPLVVLADHRAVLRPLRLAGMDRVLTIRPTLESALALITPSTAPGPRGAESA